LILALLLVPVILRLKRGERSGFLFPGGGALKVFPGGIKARLYKNLFYLRIIGIAAVISAMARPQLISEIRDEKEGIAVILAVDTSSTMLAEDLELGMRDFVDMGQEYPESKAISRIMAARRVIRDFVDHRSDDLVGLVAFAAQAFIVCPPTFDHEWLLESLKRVDVGLIKDGTAIGSGILSSLNCLKNIEARSRVVVLITDGINNFGQVPPLVAARAARSQGIKIYTIGLVSSGPAVYREKDNLGRVTEKKVIIEVNEDILKKIANLTGGMYFRAEDMDSLRRSYKEINDLEKASLKDTLSEEFTDLFPVFLIIGLGLIIAEIILANTYLRKIP